MPNRSEPSRAELLRFGMVRDGSGDGSAEGSERFGIVRGAVRHGSGRFGTASQQLHPTAEHLTPGVLKTGFAPHV